MIELAGVLLGTWIYDANKRMRERSWVRHQIWKNKRRDKVMIRVGTNGAARI